MGRNKIAKLVFIMVLTACTGSSNKERIVVNLDKPSSKGIEVKEYCEKIEILSLDDVQGLHPDSKLCVFNKGFIMKKDSISLVCFDEKGHFQQELKFDVIEDYSTYRDKRLYVLTPDRIEMFELNGLSYEGCLPLPDSSYTYCKVGGKDDNAVVVLAFRDGRNYSGEYDIKERILYFPADGGMKGSDSTMKKVLERSGFFFSEDDSYYFYSNSGEIYRMADFYFSSYQWAFQHKDPLIVSVSNVQMMSDKLFMRIETDRGDYCLITALEENGYPCSTELYQYSLTTCFPLGVFYNSINYYLCDAMDIDKYINRDLLDGEENKTDEILKTISRIIIIKYHLK